jgi:hypothetical protein
MCSIALTKAPPSRQDSDKSQGIGRLQIDSTFIHKGQLGVDSCRSRFSNQIPENLNEQTSFWGLHVTNAFEPLPRQCCFHRAARLKLEKCAAGHSRVDRPSAFGGKECMTFRAAPSAAQPEISTIRWAFRQERLK